MSTAELVDGGLFAFYVLLVILSYWMLSRVFRRVVDPTGECGLNHDIPLPSIVRWLIFAMAALLPALMAVFLNLVFKLLS